MTDKGKKMVARAPDLEQFLTEETKHKFVTYAEGARMYSLKYWTFVRLAQDAGANWTLRKTAMVDLIVLDQYLEEHMNEAIQPGKGRLMATKKDIDELNNAVKRGKKFMRIDEAKEYFSVGRHTMEKWSKDAKAIYKINGVKLINIEKIEKFLEAFLEEED